MSLRTLLRATALLAIESPLAAQPDAELATVNSIPLAEWRTYVRSDTLLVDGVAGWRNGERIFWMRFRYTHPQRFDGAPYDVRLTRYTVDCAATETRATRMVWMSGGVVVADRSPALPATAAEPGTVNRGLLNLPCAQPPAAGSAAPDLVERMGLPEARWMELATSGPERRQHADFGAVATEGAHRRVWIRVAYPAPQQVQDREFDRQYQRWEVDCGGRRVRLERMALVLGDQVLDDMTAPQSWLEPPAALATLLLDPVCVAATIPPRG